MMIEKLSIWMSNKLVQEKIITEHYYKSYKYGIEITVSSIIGFILTLTIGLICREMICSLIYYIVFVCLRMITGGFHASSYFRCNFIFCLITVFVLMFSVFSEIVYFSEGEIVLLACFSITIFVWLVPIENKNKRIEKKQKAKFKMLSIIISSFLVAFSFFLYITGYVIYSAVIVYSIVAVAILCLVTEIKPKEVILYEKN